MYDNLPGFQVSTVDGNLQAKRNPETKSITIIGTAGQGPSDSVYQVVDRPTAAAVFGFDGTLIRAMEEVAPYGDNITLFRMGTKPATLKGVGKDTGTTPTAGFDLILFGDRSTACDTNYRIYYKDTVIGLWHNQSLVWCNDPANLVDNGIDASVTGSGVAGKGLALGTANTWEGAAPLNALPATSGTSPKPAFDKTGVDGLGMTARETYVAQAKAFELLENSPTQQVFVPNCLFDTPNVALGGSDTDANTLDWLKTSADPTDGHTVYTWASETEDSDGTVVTPHDVWESGADRIGDNFHEVNFGYQLARFCAVMSKYQTDIGGCLGFIGTSVPKSFSLVDLRAWFGKAPTVDPSDGTTITAAGKGLFGIPYLKGTSQAALASLCHDKGNAIGRQPGFFENMAGEYDGGADLDANQRPIDIGAYLHVVSGCHYLQNGYGNYTANMAGLVCGFVARLDEKSSPTNKELVGVTMRYRPTLAQLDALTATNLNELRFHGLNDLPRMTHGMTAATDASDFDRLVRQRIKFLVVQVTAAVADPFIGESTTDGLQLQAMKTALDAAYLDLKKRGYIGNYNFVISATEAQQKIGYANISISFSPANELVRLNATVGVSKN